MVPSGIRVARSGGFPRWWALGGALAAALATAASVIWLAPVVAAQGKPQSTSVSMEWLGWSVFRFTSPSGKVVLTNPFLANPDSPARAEDITAADLILVSNGHGDEVGSTVDIAQRTGARTLASGSGLSTWLVEQGVPRAQLLSGFPQPGSRHSLEGITVRLVESVHGSELPRPSSTAPYGGVASGFILTFENGYTVYFAGSTSLMAEQALWAQMYKPDMAILHMGGDHDPLDFAMQVKLLMTDNPNLRTVVPHHNRAVPPPGQTSVAEVQAAMDELGLGLTLTAPAVGEVLTLTR